MYGCHYYLNWSHNYDFHSRDVCLYIYIYKITQSVITVNKSKEKSFIKLEQNSTKQEKKLYYHAGPSAVQ